MWRTSLGNPWVLLFQLPPSSRYSSLMLRLIVGRLRPKRRNVVEFRQKSWWNKDAYSEFRKANVIFCSCSGPRLPDELIRTSGDIYIRVHGTMQWYRHHYSVAEMADRAGRIKRSGVQTGAYFNNGRDGNAVRNVQSLAALLESASQAFSQYDPPGLRFADGNK
jgi:uncharacterized protein YecE (DUF72 family)